MANYNIVVDTSNFRPYDYSLAYRAIQDYNRGYEESLAIYDKIAQTLGDLKSAVEGSTRAKQIYDAYQDDFNTAADEFAHGMNINTARKLGELRKIYGTLIRQLERANEARVKAAEYLRALNKDNDYLHEDIGSLDEWMDDPTRQVRGYAGNRLTTEVAAMMGSVAKSMKQLNADGRLDSYNKKWIETGGFSPERISEAISQLQTGGIESVKDDIIRGVLKNVAASSGMDNWADASTLQRRNEFMARGLYGGIGETKTGHYDDKEAEALLQLLKLLELENAKQKNEILKNLIGRLTNGGGANVDGTIPINTVDILSPNYELEGQLRVINNALNTLGLKKETNGNYTRHKVSVSVGSVPVSKGYKTSLSSTFPFGVSSTRGGSIDVDLYDKKGRMLTRQLFINQGKNKGEREALGNYYDNSVENALFSMGLDSASTLADAGKVHTSGTVLLGYKNAFSNTGAFNAGFIPISMDNSDEILNKLITRFKKGEDLPAGTIMEVRGWNKKGALKLDKNVDVKDLEGDEKPEFYSHIGSKDSQGNRTELSKYIIFKKNGKTFAMPKEKLGTIVNTSYTFGDEFGVLQRNKDRYIRLKADEYKTMYDEYGVDLSDQQAIQLAALDYQSALNNSGAAYVRSIGLALGLEYKSSPFDLHTNSSSGKIQP